MNHFADDKTIIHGPQILSQDCDGKVFSWDTPPDDGHPGEAYNCRCTAEDVGSDEQKCKELKQIIANQEITVREAERDFSQLNDQYNAADEVRIELQQKCKEALLKAAKGGIEGGVSGIPGGGAGIARGGWGRCFASVIRWRRGLHCC